MNTTVPIAIREDIAKLSRRKNQGNGREYYARTCESPLLNVESMGFQGLDVEVKRVSKYQGNWGYRRDRSNHSPDDPIFIEVSKRWNVDIPLASETLRKTLGTAKHPELMLKDDEYWSHNSLRGCFLVTMEVESVDKTDFDAHRVYVSLPWEVAEAFLDIKFVAGENGFPFVQIYTATNEEGFLRAPISMSHLRNIKFKHGEVYSYNEIPPRPFDFTLESLSRAVDGIPMSPDKVDQFVRAISEVDWNLPDVTEKGTKKIMAKLRPLMGDLLKKDPLALCCLRTLAYSSHRTIDSVKVSGVINSAFAEAESAEDLSEILKNFYADPDEEHSRWNTGRIEYGIKRLAAYKGKRKAVLKSQAGRAFSKMQAEAENLTIDKKKHKKTWKAIEEGKLPMGIFFRKSEQYFILNDNWDLWEAMFKAGHGDVICDIAADAKRRTTYEKDLMSYFYFVLYGLPEYLKKHTKKKWTCSPKFVETADELEPDAPEEGEGVTRKRSALTPIVDNEACTVEVPYASLAISGRQTTYCYSHDYHVLRKGMSFKGYAITKDVEEKLNGRDDYGLMFYTFTGTDVGRGYPTFLIIFERLADGTRVHFHRTHPCRTKGGDYNPIHNWTKVCYNWMVGNVSRDLIVAQQGDLAFVLVSDEKAAKVEFGDKVEQYDKHCFSTPVPFAEPGKTEAKSNVLGYVNLDKETLLSHTEHEDVVVPAGILQIRQARSWEANPKGIWSLRID
jgi:hypothetical protein